MADKEKKLVRLNLEKSIEHGVFVTPVEGYIPNFDENLEWQDGMRAVPQDYQPFRLVLDLEMVPENANLEISFRVYFTHDDLKQIRKIKLLKWNGIGWQLISGDPISLLNNQIWAGYFEIEGYKIGDPPIALGD